MAKENTTPTWQAGINAAAIALIGIGVTMLQGRDIFGIILIGLGAGIEWFKYSKRFK